MRAVDTNVIVRLIVNDDPVQAAAAHRAMSAELVFIPKTVLLEVEWVLRSGYGRQAATIAAAIEALLATADITIEDSAAVSRAVGWFRRGMDFADALHLASSSSANAFLTFDAALRRRASALVATPEAVSPS